jgi:hypothetical protein
VKNTFGFRIEKWQNGFIKYSFFRQATGNHTWNLHENKNGFIGSQKKVRYNTAVWVVLILTVEEYRQVGLGDSMWLNDNIHKEFKQSAQRTQALHAEEYLSGQQDGHQDAVPAQRQLPRVFPKDLGRRNAFENSKVNSHLISFSVYGHVLVLSEALMEAAQKVTADEEITISFLF